MSAVNFSKGVFREDQLVFIKLVQDLKLRYPNPKMALVVPMSSFRNTLKKVFRNKFSRWLFGILHPHCGIGLAHYMSRKSRAATGMTDEHFLGEDKEWLIIFSTQMLEKKHFDYFIFGHRHLPLDFKLKDNSRYINLGDWIIYNSFAVFDGNNTELKYYKIWKMP